MARVLVVRRVVGVRGVMLNRARRWGVRWSGVTGGARGARYVVPRVGVGRRMRALVSVPVVMRMRVCHSGHRTPNVSVAHFDS